MSVWHTISGQIRSSSKTHLKSVRIETQSISYQSELKIRDSA